MKNLIEWALKNLIPLAIGLLLIVTLFAFNSCQRERGAKTETKLVTGQADASNKSGRDAVTTVGNRADADAATDDLTRSNDDAIRSADGATTPVAAGVRDAGLASLCARSAYRSDPKCVQYARTR